jgi:hypothetical protein
MFFDGQYCFTKQMVAGGNKSFTGVQKTLRFFKKNIN